MDNGLVSEVYKYFGGVWPYGDNDVIAKTQTGYEALTWGVHEIDHQYRRIVRKDDFHKYGQAKKFKGKKCLCLFEGDDGPEWFEIKLISADLIKEQITYEFKGHEFSESGRPFMLKHIEKPTPKVEQEWLPEVGQECEVSHSCLRNGEWTRVEALKHNCFDSGSFACHILGGHTMDDGCDLRWFDKFRPLKTDREKFIERAREGEMPVANEEAYKKILGDAYDKGARFND